MDELGKQLADKNVVQTLESIRLKLMLLKPDAIPNKEHHEWAVDRVDKAIRHFNVTI